MRRTWLMLCLGLAVAGAGSVALTQDARAPKAALHARMHAVGPETLVTVPWGAGSSELGRVDGDEAASEGPMSFDVADDGTVWFLDQTRFRLAQFDAKGVLLREVPIAADTFQDFEVWSDGSVVLLDRLARRLVVVLDPEGRVVRSVPVEGPGIPDGGGVTALLTDGDGVWLEFDHTERVRVLDEGLQPCKRESVRGRAFRPGAELLAARDRQGGASIWMEDRLNGTTSVQKSVAVSHDIARIVWLQTDDTGDVHAVFHLLDFDPRDPTRVVHEEVFGVRYDEHLRPRDTWSSPWVIRRWEQFREIRVGAGGTVYQMGFDDSGVTVVRWRWES